MYVEARRRQLAGRYGKRSRVAAHELAPDGMLFIVDLPAALELLRASQHELIEHYFAHRVRCPHPPGDDPHRQVAVAAERPLNDREANGHGAEVEISNGRRRHLHTRQDESLRLLKPATSSS
jgi:hypothetical protein